MSGGIMKKTGTVVSLLLIICGVVPLFYGVLNTGSVTLLLTGLFVAFLVLYWKKLSRALRIVSAACLCLGFFIFTLVSAFMVRQAWFRQPPYGESFPIIILGGRVYEHGPSLILSYRLDAAAAYLKKNPDAVCVVSGGRGADEPEPEAEVMARYLSSKHGIAPERIVIEDKSSNTRENIRFSNALLDGETSVAIATDSFHQLRASIFAKSEGLTSYSVPSFTPPGLFPSYWVRDMLGVLYALVTT